MFEKTLTILPAWDRRDDDPKKDYGVHGVEMRWVLKGEKGATQFVLFTNWMLPHLATPPQRPTAADLGFHAREMPNGYDEESASYMHHTHCDILGDPCYYDGSGLNAESVFDLLVSKGGDAVWERLEEYYSEIFTDQLA